MYIKSYDLLTGLR